MDGESPTPTAETAHQHASAVRNAIGLYSSGAAAARQAVADAEAAGLKIAHDLDAALVAGAHTITRISCLIEEEL